MEAFHSSQAGQPTDDPVLRQVSDPLRRHQIPSVLLDQLAYGTAMDIEEKRDGNNRPGSVAPSAAASATRWSPRRPSSTQAFDDLISYCYRVASVVGLVCIRVFGYRDPAAEPLAERRGLAFQFTIVRDVQEDAGMGRVYIPQEDLTKFDIAASELRAGKDLERIRPAGARGGSGARIHRAADDLIPLIDEDSQPALWVLVTIYRRLLEKIAQRGFDVFQGKISLTAREKLVILGKGFLKRLA